MFGLNARQLALAASVAAVTLIAGALHYAGVDPTAVFVVSGFALAGLAWLVSLATDELGARFGPSVTGILQSTLGNLPELFIVIFAIRAGETVVAQTSILGSLFANGLLVLGAAIVVGARHAGGVMRFGRRLPNDTATLLMLAVFIIVLLGVSDRIGDRASQHQITISVVGAIVLLGVYVAWLVPYVRRGAKTERASGHAAAVPLSAALLLLGLAGVGAALVSDWFVAALDPAIEQLGISKMFTGLVIVGIAGNAVENVVGIALAAKGQFDLSVSVVKNSVAQIAAFLYPILVLISLLFESRLTFVLNPVLAAALLLSALALWQITGDGEAYAYEGWALVALFVVLATVALYE